MRLKNGLYTIADLNIIYDYVRSKLLSQSTGVSRVKLNLLLEMERKAMAGTHGLDVDELPQGQGKFGYEPTNPVPVDGLLAKEIYLSDLVTSTGKSIVSKRVRAVTVPNIENPIDEMSIFDSSGAFITNLYFSCYQKKISEKAPEGFKFMNRE